MSITALLVGVTLAVVPVGDAPPGTRAEVAMAAAPGGLVALTVTVPSVADGWVELVGDGAVLARLPLTPVRDGARATLVTGSVDLASRVSATYVPGALLPGATQRGSHPGAAASPPDGPAAARPAASGAAVVVRVPPGSLTLTAASPAGPSLRLRATDTRAGEHGFTLVGTPTNHGSCATAVPGVRAIGVPGNALAPARVRTAPAGGASDGPTVLARLPAGVGLGSVDLVVTPGPATVPRPGCGAARWTLTLV